VVRGVKKVGQHCSSQSEHAFAGKSTDDVPYENKTKQYLEYFSRQKWQFVCFFFFSRLVVLVSAGRCGLVTKVEGTREEVTIFECERSVKLTPSLRNSCVL